MDFFVRDRNIRNGVGLFIIEGPAKKALEVVPRIEDHSATYLLKIPQNIETSSRIAYNHSLGDTINCMLAKDDFVLPRIDVSKREIKIIGGALMKRGKMVGWLGELDVESINLIRNMYKGGIVVAQSPGEKKGTVTMDINKTKAKIKPIVRGEEVGFDILIKIWGDYAEQTGWDFRDKIDEKFIKGCEENFARVIEEQCNKTIKKLQKEYNADALQLNKVLRAEEPAYWKKIENEREEHFPNIEINVKVEVKINLVGNIK